MNVKNSLKSIPLTTFSSASLTVNYQAINSSGLPQSCTILRIVNNNTTAVTLSYDGTTDHDFIAPNSLLVLDAQTNAQPNSFGSFLAKGTVVYVKGTAGTGTIALAGYYNPVA